MISVPQLEFPPSMNAVKKMKYLSGQARQEELQLMNDNEADLVRHLKSFKQVRKSLHCAYIEKECLIKCGSGALLDINYKQFSTRLQPCVERYFD